MTHLSLVALLVDDYDEAIAWYAGLPGFVLKEDSPQGDGKRWVVVGPREGASLLLAKADGETQRLHVGHQSGGRVFLFIETAQFDIDHRNMRQAGVVFEEEPRHEAFGTVAVFRDLYGNRWDLIEKRALRDGGDKAA